MKERPILFSSSMVRAILDGRKTMTRRIVKPHRSDDSFVIVEQPNGDWWPFRSEDGESFVMTDGCEYPFDCPYGQPGDKLWCRETWGLHAFDDETCWYTWSGAGKDASTLEDWAITYRADWGPCQDGCHWRSSIHMPRWASRITLEITGVHVERLQDISEADAIAEGCTNSLHLGGGRFANENFAHLWWQINGDGSWEANPWVWCIEFKRVTA